MARQSRSKPLIYVSNGKCSTHCSLNPSHLPARFVPQLAAWYDQGFTDFKIELLAHEAGVTISHGAIGRHRRFHLRDGSTIATDDTLAELDDIESLDLILKRGQTFIPSWKITPSEYFKAMEMKYRLTSGSTMDAMFAAMAAAGQDLDMDRVDSVAVAEPVLPVKPVEHDDTAED